MHFNNSDPSPSSLLEKAEQGADKALQSTEQVANDALKMLTEAIHDLRLQTLPLAARTGEQVSALAQRGVDSVRESSHQLRLKAEHASECTVAYIKHDPVKSVLIAAATGAALMALISLFSHSRHRS